MSAWRDLPCWAASKAACAWMALPANSCLLLRCRGEVAEVLPALRLHLPDLLIGGLLAQLRLARVERHLKNRRDR